MARFVITGGAGFIGSHAAEHFAARGHEVVIVDNLSRGALLQQAGSQRHATTGTTWARSPASSAFAATSASRG